jgi:hypothetical protein
MVTLEATIECVEEKYFLKINVEQGPVAIPLSDDNPNAVKSAFNKLIQRIVNADLKLTRFSCGRRFKTDTPPLQ